MVLAPVRWYDYSRFGKVLANRFVALKVPLDEKFSIHGKDRFTPSDVLQDLPAIGAIVDLTNTKKYYDPNVFTANGVDYHKVFVKGHVVPELTTVERFIQIVNGFVMDEENNGKLIGVHCTHGLNRTGYLVCAYLIMEQGYTPENAINLFNGTRGHRMERKNYLDSLRGMYPVSGRCKDRFEPNERSTGSTGVIIPKRTVESIRKRRHARSTDTRQRDCHRASDHRHYRDRNYERPREPNPGRPRELNDPRSIEPESWRSRPSGAGYEGDNYGHYSSNGHSSNRIYDYPDSRRDYHQPWPRLEAVDDDRARYSWRRRDLPERVDPPTDGVTLATFHSERCTKDFRAYNSMK